MCYVCMCNIVHARCMKACKQGSTAASVLTPAWEVLLALCSPSENSVLAPAGANQSPNVYVDDCAQAYVQALQHGKPGSVYHVANGFATGKQVAEAIAAKHSLPVKSITQEEAAPLYGPFLTYAFSKDNKPDTSRARTELHWQPQHGSDYFLECVAGRTV